MKEESAGRLTNNKKLSQQHNVLNISQMVSKGKRGRVTDLEERTLAIHDSNLTGPTAVREGEIRARGVANYHHKLRETRREGKENKDLGPLIATHEMRPKLRG